MYDILLPEDIASFLKVTSTVFKNFKKVACFM